MKITVAICTWNRVSLLEKTLEQITLMNIPSGLEWELLVIDNGSTDSTPELLRRYLDVLPVRIVYEPTKGHCHARNSAVNHCTGDWVVWTDDDVLVNSNWLAEYADAIVLDPTCDFLGGVIDPWFESTPPEWISTLIDLLNGPYAIRSESVTNTPISAKNLPFGANMAMRASLLRENRFDTRIGRVGTGMMSGDETTLFRTLISKGHFGRWVPKARVRHFIPNSRLSQNYIYAFASGLAEGEAIQANTRGRFPRWCIRKLIEANFVRILHFRQKNRYWLNGLLEAARAEGTIRGWLRHQKSNSAN